MTLKDPSNSNFLYVKTQPERDFFRVLSATVNLYQGDHVGKLIFFSPTDDFGSFLQVFTVLKKHAKPVCPEILGKRHDWCASNHSVIIPALLHGCLVSNPKQSCLGA